MSQFWRHVVNIRRVLLKRTAALDAGRTRTSSAVMWWDRRYLDIHTGARIVDNK